MKKILILAIGIFISNTSFGQKVITKTGEVKFEASMPAFEEIAATNNSASCVLDKSTGDIAALVLVKSLKFKAPLMEEHFNENYMESDKFPKATFKGKILNFDASKLPANKTAYDLEGDLTIHGVTKKVKTKIMLSNAGQKVVALANFSVKPKDFNIDIPALVKEKIAENVKIALNFLLEQK
jgi:polyisoprenoid-binding protein YceI